MSKEEIVNQLKKECVSQGIDITKSSLSKIHDMFIKIVKNALIKNNPIRLHGIGTLNPIKRKERQCRNPRSGEMIDIPEKVRVKFSTSSTLDDGLNPELKKEKVN